MGFLAGTCNNIRLPGGVETSKSSGVNDSFFFFFFYISQLPSYRLDLFTDRMWLKIAREISPKVLRDEKRSAPFRRGFQSQLYLAVAFQK